MYKFVLAIRYLFKRRISYFSVAATGLCVFVVLVVITVLSGLTREFKENTHRFVGDCVVSSKSLVGFGYYEEFVGILEGEGTVEAVSPAIKSYAMVLVEGGRGSGTVEVMGIEPVAHSRVTGFSDWLYYNRGDAGGAFEPSYDPELVGCVPGINIVLRRDSEGGYEIASGLVRLKFEVGCFPLTARGAPAKGGAGEVSTKTFYYSDHVRSGLAKADGNLVYLPFDELQLLCGMGTEPKRVSALFIKFKEGVKLDEACERVKLLWEEFAEGKAGAMYGELLGNVTVQSWKNYSRVIVAAVETEQTMMIVVFGMVGIITVFIVFVVFYMIVSHKSKDIGILKSVGVSRGEVLVLFLFFAFLVGVLGSAIGALGGWGFLVHINQIEDWLFKHFEFQLWNRRIYAIGDIPNVIDFRVLSGIIFSAVLACLAGALIPSWQACRLKPVKTLRVSQL
jgi:lipoprotein-releasing system permease protein